MSPNIGVSIFLAACILAGIVAFMWGFSLRKRVGRLEDNLTRDEFRMKHIGNVLADVCFFLWAACDDDEKDKMTTDMIKVGTERERYYRLMRQKVKRQRAMKNDYLDHRWRGVDWSQKT